MGLYIATLCYFKISSFYLPLHSEVNKLKTFLIYNGYPKAFVDRGTRVFVDGIFSLSSCNPDSRHKKPIYFSILYTGTDTLQPRAQLPKLCSSVFLRISLHKLFSADNFIKYKRKHTSNQRSILELNI